jgi:phage baseplate assembly protein W
MAVTRADLITAQSRKLNVYSDFDDNFLQHPMSNSLVVLKNQDSIRQALKNMLLTNPGERLFDPFFGSGITGMLFENYTPFVQQDIIRKIALSMSLYEPRAQLLNISVIADPDNDGFNVNITFSLINIPEPGSLKLFISRTR